MMDGSLIRRRNGSGLCVLIILKKMKIRSSCEIEYFVETHLCKLCVILTDDIIRYPGILLVERSMRAEAC